MASTRQIIDLDKPLPNIEMDVSESEIDKCGRRILTTKGLSGQQIAATNVQKFNEWVTARDSVNDWKDYIRQRNLNRSEIARECGFALSVFRQNPAIKKAMEVLEARLRSAGTLGDVKTAVGVSSKVSEAATTQAVDRRIMAAKGKAEQRVKMLEEQNAALRAEVRDLRDQLAKYRHLDAHLCSTGRLLHA